MDGRLTSERAWSIGGQANVLSGAKNDRVGRSGGGALTDTTKDTTLLSLLAQSLNFSTFMTDRGSKLQTFKDADLSKGVGENYQQYEKDLDKNVGKMQSTFKLWDSLYSYMIDGASGSSTVESVNADGVLSTISKSKGTHSIGGASITAGKDFVNSYMQELTTLGGSAYSEIERALSLVLNNTAINGKGVPFGSTSFIALMKNKDIQNAQSPDPALPKATGGIIPSYFNNGALVNYKPQGTDTVPAMLTPGEFVINRAATQKNLPLLKAINRGGMQYASNGGVISPSYYNVGGSVSGSGGGYSMSSTVFDNFISSFNQQTNNLGGLIDNLAKVFPALSGPVSAFGGHISRFERAIDRLSNVEIQGPNIPDTINVNSDTIRVELIAPADSSYSLSDEDKNQITDQLTNRLRSLTTMGR